MYGLLRTLRTVATTPTAAREAEAGTLTNGATEVSDTSASGTKAVKFTAGPGVPSFMLGMAYGSNTNPTELETRLGAPLHMRRTYYRYDQQNTAVNHINQNIAAGRLESEISFKLQHTWAQTAAGAGDAWASALATTLQNAVAGKNHHIKVIMNHEPENDAAPNDGATTAGRDAWKAMQARLAPYFNKPGLEFGCCLMGYHSFYGSAAMKELWAPQNCIPTSGHIKFISFDIYESMDAAEGSAGTRWKNFEGYYQQAQAYQNQRAVAGMPIAWGMSESGIVATAFAKDPLWFDKQFALMQQYGGSWYSYFNTDLNSSAPWIISPNDAREQAFGRLLRAANG